ncbi:site-specific integrase [Subsaximicrobium wynnwilliamsii]|uniref:Site-specific integrase n=1 Tax=Subsaximicrobium wynnwilliamsii TaxID=291179 RepID=A0A5C6ZGL3_9FLAO|nr:site-specific integrase [Subsaximicrobium wynnwilliamsii]TXD83472.1 site-specific integrase [Subsaximicrobium wynnwilliamsii]TXD89253.1 site-specific integrase [Subsaximicrobium wynnwilliamsii]TXE03152.1 site-specific integrase [Subsaximicrobium wynnwilliamsii]
MRTTKTFSIRFWADAQNANNNIALVYARLTVNQKRLSLSLKRRLPLDLWDAKSQRLRGNSSEAKEINQYFQEVRTRLFQIYQDLKFKNELITAQKIKSAYCGDNESSKTLIELINYHGNKIENTHAAGSIRNFVVTEGYIKKFMLADRKTSDVFLKQMDYKFICDFERFLHAYYPKGHKREMTHNTVMKHIQRLRKMVTLAYHLEWLDKDPFIRWKMTFEKKERDFLTTNELSNLETYDFPIERLERVRDLFLFSCYTGISYVDVKNLKPKHILEGMDGNNWIITHRQKTKTKVKVPLLDKAKLLLEKYENHPMALISETLFPILSNEKTNLYLKEIASAVGIRKNLTFHMARHTFATTVTLSNGVPIETVSKLLGHTKVATTQIYARVLEEKLSKDMIDLQKTLNAKDELKRE